MKKNDQYVQSVTKIVQEARDTKKPIVIFGAGRGGWYIMKVLKHFHIAVDYFADNNPSKQGTYHDYPVQKPEKLAEKFSQATVLLGILNPENFHTVNNQLHAIGFAHTHYIMDAFLFVYFTKVAQRKCNPEKFATSISLLYENHQDNSLFFSPTLSYVITQKCTLRCKDCGAFVPYYKAPKSIPTQTIINDIKRYCAAFDVVHHIALQGGEPFLHSELQEICQGIASIDNLIFIDFVTNGTILPAKKTITNFFECGNCVLISDYGSASTKLEELSNACYENGIYFDYYRYDENGWGKPTPVYKRHRSNNENNILFQECIKHTFLCCQIMDTKLHRCSFSNNCSYLNLLPEFEDDFVRLNNPDDSIDNLKEKIRLLTHRTTAIKACDYCPASEHKCVPAGIQLPKGTKENATI